MSLTTWDSPTGTYSSSIPSGMAVFRKVIAQEFDYTRTEVVRDRSRCAATRSEHCECGACDFFTTVVVKGRKLFDWCVDVAEPLGIQSVIFNRRVVGFGNPKERQYTGPSPHTDHVHIGLNRWARQNLTEKMVRDALDGVGEDDDMDYATFKKFMDDYHADKSTKPYQVWKDNAVTLTHPDTGEKLVFGIDTLVQLSLDYARAHDDWVRDVFQEYKSSGRAV